jgi:cytochrome c oxidase cbb3-type subunit 3
MSSRVVLALVLTLLSLSSTGCRRRHASVQSPAVREGRALYLKYCALCHGKSAEGYAADHANALGNQDFLAIASKEFLVDQITHGHPGTPMAAWGRLHGGPLDQKQVDRIATYLRSLAKTSLVKTEGVRAHGDPGRGAQVWTERCRDCHGARAEGSARATSLSHPSFLHAVSDGYLRYAIKFGRRGTEMQAFARPRTGAALTDQQVDDVIAHLRTLEAIPGPLPPPDYEPPPGLDQLVMNPTSAPPTFTLKEGRYVPADDVEKAIRDKRKMVLLDARATSDWSRSHIVGALPFPFYDIDKMAKTLPNDGTWIVAYCACPHAASGHVVDELRRRGFKNTAVLDEGIGYWQQKSYPTAQAKVLPSAQP